MLDELEPFERTLHAVLAQEVWLEAEGEGPEGEEARGEVAMCAHHVRRLGEKGGGGAGDGPRPRAAGEGPGREGERPRREGESRKDARPGREGARRKDARPRREGEDFVIYGRYFDRYRRGADGRWRFAARRLEVGWTELRAVRLPG